MFQATTPRDLLIAGLAAVGALYVVVDLLRQLDRLRMAGEVRDDLERLPTTEPTEQGGPTE